MENKLVKKALEVVNYFKSQGKAHLTTKEVPYTGNRIELERGSFLNFSVCDYLGLATDQRVKEGASKAALKYGVYTSISRTFLKLGIYEEAEQIVSQIFNKPVLLLPRTTLSHITVVPIIIGRKDALILDHQVHATVRIATDMVKSYGIHVETIRHSNLQKLEERYDVLKHDYDKIWYFTDGVFSMFGDTVPVKGIKNLLAKLEKLYLYVDDAHGMSWTGEHGKGFFLSKTDYDPKMFVITSLGKGFGAGGSAIICADNEIKEKIEILGIPLMFTSPVEPATLGAIIASTKIHLSNEIIERQEKLNELMGYFYSKAKELDLPVVDFTHTPIALLAAGKPEVDLELGEILFQNHIHVTGAMYPAVPYNNSGVRIIINLYQNKKDIEKVLSVLRKAYDIVLEKHKLTNHDILKHFKLGKATV